jgi:ABC-2 type transport system ATP-binding protein
MTDQMVRVDGLTRRYGSLTAVDGLSFEVRRGEMFGLIGPDGAGKTTTLRAVLGLAKPEAGHIATCGLSPRRQHAELTQRVGYLSQRFSLYGDLTVDENVAFFAEIHGVEGWRARRDELLDMVRMRPFRKRLADKLSGGMKQKLALMATLIHTPDLLVLDEPTTGVDPVSRRDFWRLLARLKGEGLTILLTTPYLDEAERCERVALLDHGRMLSSDAPEALCAAWDGVLLEVVARPQRAAVDIVRGVAEGSEVEVFGERLHVSVPRAHAADVAGLTERLRTALSAAGVVVAEIRPTAASLEDVFIHAIRGAEAQRAAGREGQS